MSIEDCDPRVSDAQQRQTEPERGLQPRWMKRDRIGTYWLCSGRMGVVTIAMLELFESLSVAEFLSVAQH